MGILSDRQIERDVKITPFVKGAKIPGTISNGLGSYGYDVTLGYKFQVFSNIHATEIDPKNFDPKALVAVDLTPTYHNFDDAGPWKNRCRRCGLSFTKAQEIFKTEQCPGHDSVPIATKPNFVRIPPYSFLLGESIEEFDIPRDVLVVCVGKSTYARCGLNVNCTPGEPEWKGKWTIEISNPTSLPARVYCGEGIAQCLFFRSDERAEAVQRHFLDSLHGRDFSTLAALNKELNEASCRVSYADRKGKYNHQAGLTLPIPEQPK